MPSIRPLILSVAALVLIVGTIHSATAALPDEAKEKLSKVRDELKGVSKLVRAKEYDKAEMILSNSGEEIADIEREAGPENANDRTIIAAKKYYFDQKERFHKSKGVSFVSEIAPIFNEKCMRCHGDRANGGLDLSTFNLLAKGGNTGEVLVPGNPRRSLLMAKLLHPVEQQRMPRGGSPLDPEELLLISVWIDEGAKFDSDKPNDALGDLIRAARSGSMEKVEITKATGMEKVSFTRDVAPTMVRLCVGCHSGNNPRGGLDMTTFERIMQGGDSGRVIIPGNLEGSRMFRLVGGLENPRMPAGQARITRAFYADFKTWFEEGNKFDGDNVKTPLRDLVPSDMELRASELAKMSPDEWKDFRMERTESQWKRTLPRDAGSRIETDEFLLWGNVRGDRLKAISEMADKHLRGIKGMFDDENKSASFKGRLAVIVFKDRFGYEEFYQTIESRRPELAIVGHAKVSNGQEDAYIVLQDVGDDPEAGQMDLETSLVTQLTDAYLQRDGQGLPGWIAQGAGLYLASRSGADKEYLRSLPKQAAQALTTVTQPQDIFADGAFSPTQTTAVGYTLVGYMISNGGSGKFGQFISRLRNGSSVDGAAKAIYKTSAANIAVGYSKTLPRP